MLNLDQLFPIGIGTFQIDLNEKEETLNGLLTSTKLGQNYFDVSSQYENGAVMEYMKTVFKQLKRDTIFVNCKISNDIYISIKTLKPTSTNILQ
jgi:diketogulonate reductase-like aldo/keto reductase